MGFLDKLLGRDKPAHDHSHDHDHDHDHDHSHDEPSRTVVNHEEQAKPTPSAPAGDATADKV